MVDQPRLKTEHLQAYALYTTCKMEKVPRSLLEISTVSGISIRKLRFVEKISSSENNNRIKSISAEDLLHSFYPYFDLKYSDLRNIIGMMKNSHSTVKFSPAATAGGLIHIYCNQKKNHKKCPIKKISCVFQTTPMSIYRYQKDYKENSFDKN